jgi:glycosyltransferase domain-containing protein
VIDDLSIVTICFERRAFLKRYLETSKVNGFTTILVDGSAAPYTSDLPENVTYHHMPGESARERLNFAISEVKTEYMVLLADDDYMLASTLLKGLEFLKNNVDYSSVQGKVLTVNELYEKSDLLFKSYKAFDQPAWLEDPHRTTRLAAHFQQYIFTFYSVQKSVVWKQFFSHIYPKIKEHPSFSLNYPAIFELAQSIHCVLHGKNKMLDEVYLVRESIPRIKGKGFTANFEFNESDVFVDFINEFAMVCNDTFPARELDYQVLLQTSFADFAKRRKHNIENGHFNVLGNITNCLETFSGAAEELLSIYQSITAYRAEIVSMLKETGVSCSAYWYDEYWFNQIANKFASLTNQYTDFVIYGAGEHTLMLSKTQGLGKGLRCIADKNHKYWGKTVEGVPCIAPNEILTHSHNVIISSQYYEKEISQYLIELFGDEINILTLY